MLPERLLADVLAGRAHDHAMNLYDDDVDLLRAVALHVLDGGLTLGQRIVIVATPEHRTAIDEALRARGADPEELRRTGDYLALDAAETLAAFMVDGVPDKALFDAAVEQAVVGDGRPRVYGEMVALLWAEGNVTGALALESLWNDLADRVDFSLLCGYPMAALDGHGDLQAVREVCQVHTGVVSPRRYRSQPHRTPPLADVLERTEVFLSVPDAVGGVRRWLGSTLTHWDEQGLVDDANVVASELATNAIQHAESPFRVTVTRISADDLRSVRLAVEDLSGGHPSMNAEEHEALGGRGVHLVAQLAWRWGVESRPTGKVVWAEFRARDRRSSPR